MTYSFILKKGLRIRRRNRFRRTWRNESQEVVVEMENRSPLPLFHLFAFDEAGELKISGNNKRLYTLFPGEKKILSYQVSGGKRGTYTIGPLKIEGSDPLGLFPWRVSALEKETLLIYPAVYPLELPPHGGLPGGALKTPNPAFEDLTCYRSLREYIPGDDPKRINWKVSARLGSLHTMQYQPSLHYSAIVLLNLNEEDYPLRYRFSIIERAIDTAASLIFHSTRERQGVGLAALGGDGFLSFPVRKSESHAVELLEVLAGITPHPGPGNILEPVTEGRIKLPAACRLMYVGPQLPQEKIFILAQMKRRGIYPELYYLINRGNSEAEEHPRGIPRYFVKESGDELLTRK